MLDIREAEYGGEMLYINKSKHHPMWAMEYCRDEGLRKYWDEYSYPYHKNGEGNNSFRSAMTNKVQKRWMPVLIITIRIPLLLKM